MKTFLSIISLCFLLSCSKEAGESANLNDSGNGSGKGGSLARFTIVNNYLYLVDDNTLKVFSILDPQQAVLSNTVNLRGGVETIYSFKDKLFIGATDGMYIYSIADQANPQFMGEALHTRSCDPVVANDSIAFVTLRGNQPCGPAEDGLYIYNIRNIFSPTMLNMQAIPTPHGLGLQDSILYVCQKTNGLSIYNVKNPSTPILRRQLSNRTFEDVICYGNLLICYVSTGLAIYDVSDPVNPQELSLVNN